MPTPYIDYSDSKDPNFPTFKAEFTSLFAMYRRTADVFKYSSILNTALVVVIGSLDLGLTATSKTSDVINYIKTGVAFSFAVINIVSGAVKVVNYPKLVSLAKTGLIKKFFNTPPLINQDLEAKKVVKAIEDLTPDEEKVIETFAEGLINKVR